MNNDRLKVLLTQLSEGSLTQIEYDKLFSEFYIKIKKQAMQICIRVTKPYYDCYLEAQKSAEDLVEEVLVMLYEKFSFQPHEGDEESIVIKKFFKWISLTAHNQIRTYQRNRDYRITDDNLVSYNTLLSSQDENNPSNEEDQHRGEFSSIMLHKIVSIVERYLNIRAKAVFYHLIKPFGGHLSNVPEEVKLSFISEWKLSGIDHLRSVHNDTLKAIRRRIKE